MEFKTSATVFTLEFLDVFSVPTSSAKALIEIKTRAWDSSPSENGGWWIAMS